MAPEDDAMAGEADGSARVFDDNIEDALERSDVSHGDDDDDALPLSAEPSSSRPSTDRGSRQVSQADAGSDVDADNATTAADNVHVDLDHDAGADDAEVLDLREDASRFLQQINESLPSTVDVSTDEQLDPLLSVRMWTERRKKQWDALAEQTSEPVFVPMQVVLDDGESDLFSVIPFQSGVYRGQVAEALGSNTLSELVADTEDQAASQEDALPRALLPHGFGVWMSVDGSCRCGQWVQGEQNGVGTQQHRGVLTFEGEWANDCPTGAGIGVFANGSSFVGEWVSGRPYGLGSLRSVVEEQMMATEEEQSTFGWFYGTQCLQRCHRTSIGEDEDKKATQADRHHLRLDVPSKFEDQPLRGLYVAAMRLEDWRLTTFQRVLDHWRLVCCGQAIERAKQSRLLAMIAWQKAHVAQQKAIDAHIRQTVEQRKHDNHGLVQLTLKSRYKHARVLHVRQFHEQRRTTAEFQCELARCCVDTQQDTVGLMEGELSTILKLLEEAKQAQADCSEYSHQLQLIKRQIENVSLKINDVRLRRERERQGAVKAALANSGLAQSRPGSSSIPGTPLPMLGVTKKTSMKGLPRIEQVATGGNQTECDIMIVNPDSVCDVPGCECGIPRDVFMRVGAALNGES